MAQHIPTSDEGIEDLIAKGIIYTYRRDKGHRPILIINVLKLLGDDVGEERLV
jgi:hypothetical protein